MEKEYLSSSVTRQGSSEAISQSFLYNVFLWMFAGLLMTAIVSYLFSSDYRLLSFLVGETGLTPLGYVVMFAPIGFVLLMSLGFQRFSYVTLIALFMVYAAIMGASLSFIFLLYTANSIFSTFVVSAAMFGAMALYGYTTKTDLTRIGNILFMGLIGIVIAGLVNFFLKSNAMSYVISAISVVVFTGLTAYDVQKLKRIGSGVEYGSEMAGKLSVMGALSLYLDFINLFLALLRLFGNRK
jgi:FtsH-binding integral membrane protein